MRTTNSHVIVMPNNGLQDTKISDFAWITYPINAHMAAHKLPSSELNYGDFGL